MAQRLFDEFTDPEAVASRSLDFDAVVENLGDLKLIGEKIEEGIDKVKEKVEKVDRSINKELKALTKEFTRNFSQLLDLTGVMSDELNLTRALLSASNSRLASKATENIFAGDAITDGITKMHIAGAAFGVAVNLFGQIVEADKKAAEKRRQAEIFIKNETLSAFSELKDFDTLLKGLLKPFIQDLELSLIHI